MKKEICDGECCSQRIRTEKYPQENFCRKYKKPIVDVKFCSKAFKGGWVTPDGELIPSGFAEHDASARNIIKERFPVLYDRDYRGFSKEREDARKDFLCKKGWILITGNPHPAMGFSEHLFVVCNKREKINPKQNQLIEDLINNGIRMSGTVEVREID